MSEGFGKMKTTRIYFFAVLGLALSSVPASAHHAQAPFFDQSRLVEIKGVVRLFDFRNPHPVIYVQGNDENGDLVEWAVQFGNATNQRRRGWTADIIAPGERIVVSGHPSWNPGTHGIQGRQVIKEDGRVLGATASDE